VNPGGTAAGAPRRGRRAPGRLSPAAERALVLAAQRGPGVDRDRLVEAFLPLIGSVARLYGGSPAVTRTELMQDGVVGLLRALERFDAGLGTPFWGYATWWVRQAMQQLISELTWSVVLSDRALRQFARVKTARREHVQEHAREPTLDDLAQRTGLTADQIQVLFAAERVARSLEAPIGDDEGGATVADRLSDPKAEDAYDMALTRPEAERLPDLLRELDDREQRIVRARYGMDGPEKTLRELAESLGVCAERVRQVEQQALGKLRDASCA
jgi:RNA polymerase primary sigma factor